MTGSFDPALINASEAEWTWLDEVVQAVHQRKHVTYVDSAGVKHRLAVTTPGLNATIAETHKRFGWTPVTGVYSRSFSARTGHGYCASALTPATSQGRWTFRMLPTEEPSVVPATLLVPVHPNSAGHAHYTRQIVRALHRSR